MTANRVYVHVPHEPQGDLKTLRRRSNSAAGGKKDNTASRAMWIALTEGPTYILALQYAASFGVELTGFNMAASVSGHSRGTGSKPTFGLILIVVSAAASSPPPSSACLTVLPRPVQGLGRACWQHRPPGRHH